MSYIGSATPITADLTPVGGFATVTGEGTDTVVSAPELPGYWVLGSDGDDHITGSPGPDALWGLDGDDVIDGADGDDDVFTDTDGTPRDHDVATGGAGDDLLLSASGRDDLFGGPGDDQLSTRGRLGPRSLTGGPGDRVYLTDVVGEARVVRGGGGVDRLQIFTREIPKGGRLALNVPRRELKSSVAPTRVRVATFEKYVFEARGLRLRFVGSAVDEGVVGGPGSRLRATLGGGDDVVRGTDGADTIDAGAGLDTVYGRDGDDSCLHAERTFGCETLS